LARWVREGIVAYTTVRIAAGAGVVAASLLVVGPNPAPGFADKHGWSSDDYGNKGSGRHDGYAKRGASNVVKDAINGISSFPRAGKDSKPDKDPRKMDLGSDNEDLVVAESLAPEGQMAMRSAAVAEAPAGDNLAVAVPGAGGSGYSGRPVSAFQAPRVTMGNGRTPGTHVAQPPQTPEAELSYDALGAPQGIPAAPAFPTAIEINISPLPPPLPTAERIGPADLVVEEFGYGTTDTVTDPLAGVAGLFLIPAIGAVLGYRQARAAQSLRESLRT
jgi:hypothetical protein